MKIAVDILKVLALAIVWMVLFAVLNGMLVGIDTSSISPEEQAQSGTILIVVALSNVLLLGWAIRRSGWYGWTLAFAVFWMFFGTQTFQSQIEALYFSEGVQVTTWQTLMLILVGAISAAVVSPLAVWMLGKWRKPDEDETQDTPASVPIAELAIRVVGLALVYVVIYYLFGYFVAWQVTDVRLYYTGSTEILPFFAHLGATFTADPLLIPWQFLRGLLWVAIFYPFVRMLRVSQWEKALIIGLNAGLLITIVLLIPNPLMPTVVRYAHFLETATSTFLFAGFASLVLSQPTLTVHDLQATQMQRAESV